MKTKLIVLLLFPVFLFSQSKEKELNTRIVKDINVKYVIHYPEGYKKEKHDWPLILFLHGAGERGDDLSKVSIHGPLKYIREGHKLDAIILAPQCPENEYWDNDVLYALVKDVVFKNRVDISRISITGLSMGGYGTWNMAIQYPELFSAVAPICGPIFFTFPRKVGVLKDKPVWVFHGGKDQVVPLSSSQKMVDALKKAGGNPKFTIEAGAGHDSWSKPYSDPEFYAWLLNQRQEIK